MLRSLVGSEMCIRDSVQTELVATSSGLAVATVVEDVQQEEVSVVGLLTQPKTVLQYTYTILGIVVILLLVISIVIEARRSHFTQAAYGLTLLLVMLGLWSLHAWLTTGALIA